MPDQPKPHHPAHRSVLALAGRCARSHNPGYGSKVITNYRTSIADINWEWTKQTVTSATVLDLCSRQVSQ